jgi:hypothetical protein
MKTSNVEIHERDGEPRWVLVWSDSAVEYHETAVAALSAVRERDRVLVEGGVPMALTTVSWYPCTSVGTKVVQVIARTT